MNLLSRILFLLGFVDEELLTAFEEIQFSNIGFFELSTESDYGHTFTSRLIEVLGSDMLLPTM